jgi:hypothetical protein
MSGKSRDPEGALKSASKALAFDPKNRDALALLESLEKETHE